MALRVTTHPALETILRLDRTISIWWLCAPLRLEEEGGAEPDPTLSSTVTRSSKRQHRGAPFIRYTQRPRATLERPDMLDPKPPTSWWLQRIGPWQWHKEAQFEPVSKVTVNSDPFVATQYAVRRIAQADDPEMLIRVGTFGLGSATVAAARPLLEVHSLMTTEVHDELVDWLDPDRSGNRWRTGFWLDAPSRWS